MVPIPPPPPVPSRDSQHAKLIGIFHFVMAGMSIFGGLFLIAHYLIMRTAFSNPRMFQQGPNQPPFDPTQFFHAFVWFYVLMGVWALFSVAVNVISGICILTRRLHILSLVVAGLNCINFPFGTVLGIFTFIVLLRPGVEATYAAPGAALRP